jgi:sortase (surface protein transpeptidase)
MAAGFHQGMGAGGGPEPEPVPAADTITTAKPDSGPAPESPAPQEPRRAGVIRAVEPATIRIPAIGVQAPVIQLGLQSDGDLEVPTDFGDTGWWSGGARPGAVGASVIAGHVDSKSGPAVFYRLRDLEPGDLVHVSDALGASVTFEVEELEQHPKDEFPTEKVYDSAGFWPMLRLVTCAGSFDQSTGHYRDNTIVYARLVDGSSA